MLDKKVLDQINSTIEKIKSYRKIYCEKTKDNPTCKLAKQIYRTIPILYGESSSTSSIALRWKGQFCENSKMLAYHNEIPEMNHNEIVPWVNKNVCVIPLFLNGNSLSRNKKRM